MLKKSLIWLTAMLVVNLVVAVPFAFAQTSGNAQAEAIKKKVVKFGGGTKITVVRNDGAKFKGAINNASAETFTIRYKAGSDSTFRYDEVRKVTKGGIPLGVTIAGVAAAAGVAIIVLSFVVKRVCNESNC